MSDQPQYTINFDRTANQPCTEGIHSFVVSKIDEGESSNNNPMWTVRLTCIDDGGPDEGKEVTMWLVLTDSARWKLEKFLDAVNAPATGSGDYRNFVGRRFRAQIKHRNNDGRIMADVGDMFPFSTGPSKPTQAGPAKTATVTPSTRQPAGAPAGRQPAATPTGNGPATASVKRPSKGLPADSTEGGIE
jgi:hypothetical protein